MSLFLRCQWWSPAALSIDGRFSEVGRVALAMDLLSRLGPRWFRLGRSRKDALTREVPLKDLHTNRRLWRHVSLGDIDAGGYWALSTWSGQPDGEDATFDVTIHEPANQPDGIGISTDLEFLKRTVAWNDVVEAARRLSEQLGGCSVVASTELYGDAAARGIPHSDHAAYAAFWGVDRSGRNPLYRWLATSGHTAPFEVVACDSWDEVSAPDTTRLLAIAENLAAVADAARAGVRT